MQNGEFRVEGTWFSLEIHFDNGFRRYVTGLYSQRGTLTMERAARQALKECSSTYCIVEAADGHSFYIVSDYSYRATQDRE